jgi:hypothetical protein
MKKLKAAGPAKSSERQILGYGWQLRTSLWAGMDQEPKPVCIEIGHGSLCSCRILSAAVNAGPGSCSFNYCWKVLHKHWVMQCNHGDMGGLKELPEEIYEPVILSDGSIEVVRKG